MNKLECYRQSDCCFGEDCILLGVNKDKPCWGKVEVVDEEFNYETGDYKWIHSCEGHWEVLGGGYQATYKKKPE